MNTDNLSNENETPILRICAVSGSTLIREHCRFKNAPCNYTGRGWYDRCAWCKDNNGFRNKNEDTTKLF